LDKKCCDDGCDYYHCGWVFKPLYGSYFI